MKKIPRIEIQAKSKNFLGMASAKFLHNYWQKCPLLIRGAFTNFKPPLSPNDLAGLACEESALSRLVIHAPKRDRWTVRNGPFTETSFAKLPKKSWTLLVQDVDKWDTDVATLLDTFSFLPSWRIDDIMISYAVDDGSVGAHVDQYDVFLLQGLGQRRWQISTDPQAPKDFRADTELKLLKHFEPTHEWILEPGDMLYLPAGVPHHGVAVGECMTFSIGMRAPSQAELILDFAEFLAESLSEEQRYIDPDLAPAKRAGEIDDAALRRVQESLSMLRSPLISPLLFAGEIGAHRATAEGNFCADLPSSALRAPSPANGRTELNNWFGRFITRYRSAQLASPPSRATDAATLQKKLRAGAQLMRHPWARFAWHDKHRKAELFVSGQSYRCSVKFAQLICSQRTISPGDLVSINSYDQIALVALINDGHFVLSRPLRKNDCQ